jgi:hypothetical protein
MRVHVSSPSGLRTLVICLLATTLSCLVLLPLSASAQYVATNLVSNAPGALLQESESGQRLGAYRLSDQPLLGE